MIMFAIDFGTSRSKCAHIDPAGKPTIILNNRGEPFTPTVVCLPQSGEPLIGADAVEQGYLEPSRYIQNFKLKLGTTENLLSNGQTVTATDAAAIVLDYLKNMAEKQFGVAVTECVVTCPANFRDDSKQALLEACERVGLKVLKLVHEPTAAGFAYALNKSGEKTYIVYDWGGGTFDVSIQHVKGEQISTLATEGVAELGGVDLNECIKRRVLDHVQAEFGVRPNVDKDPLFSLDLDQRVEAAKISLNNRKKVPIVVPYNGNQTVFELTQEEFHKDIDPLIEQTLEAVHKAILSADLKIEDIDHLVMVGGTSRIQYVQQKVSDATGLYPKTEIDPDKAVVYGAAYASIMEMTKQGKTVRFHGQVIPSPEVFVRDVTAHAVGCCVVDVSGPKKRLVNSVIIEKNTSIPCQRSDQFYLEHEDQVEARIEILQGEPDAERDECLLIGELALSNLPKEIKRTPRISVEYTIDANGMVTATAMDKVSGQQQTVSVDYKKGIKPKDKPAAA
jgi:molecular chaperone DnaK